MKEQNKIKLIDVANLMKEIKNETDAFRRKILNSIDISGCSFAKPTSVALSYINGKYALSLIPYGRYMIHDDGEVSVKPSIGSDLTIANTLLIKNYYIIKSALMELENNPPRYNVGYAQPRGYMSSTIEKHGITITVYDSAIRFSQNNADVELLYKVLENQIEYRIRDGVKKQITNDMLHNTIINLLTGFSVPIDDLPLIMKSRLGALNKEEMQNEALSYRK